MGRLDGFWKAQAELNSALKDMSDNKRKDQLDARQRQDDEMKRRLSELLYKEKERQFNDETDYRTAMTATPPTTFAPSSPSPGLSLSGLGAGIGMQSDPSLTEITGRQEAPHPDRLALDYWRGRDRKEYDNVTDRILKTANMIGKDGGAHAAIDYYNKATGSNLSVVAQKDDLLTLSNGDGTHTVYNIKTGESKTIGDPRELLVTPGSVVLGRDRKPIFTNPKEMPEAKGFDTIDLGDRTKVIPRDGSVPYYEKKAARPDTVIKVSNGSSRPAGKPPSGYRYTDNGDLEPIPGGPADQKVTQAAKSQEGAVQAIDTAIDSVKELLSHPGRKSATGFTSITNRVAIPGGAASSFLSKLDTFKSQMFVPMVQQLKGMGQLSDAEGKKLTAAVGALEPSMNEKEFASSLSKILTELQNTRRRTAQPISGATTGRTAIPPKTQKSGRFTVEEVK